LGFFLLRFEKLHQPVDETIAAANHMKSALVLMLFQDLVKTFLEFLFRHSGTSYCLREGLLTPHEGRIAEARPQSKSEKLMEAIGKANGDNNANHLDLPAA
jgi:hypothetical protein